MGRLLSNENSKNQYLNDIKEFSYSENMEDKDMYWFIRLANAGNSVKWIQNINIYEENLFLERDYNRSNEQAWNELKNSIKKKFI